LHRGRNCSRNCVPETSPLSSLKSFGKDPQFAVLILSSSNISGLTKNASIRRTRLKNIQKIDLIYRYAHEVLCLLDHEIESLDQIDLLQNLHHFNRFGPGGYFNTFGTNLSDLSPNPEIVPSLSKILDSIPWIHGLHVHGDEGLPKAYELILTHYKS
jgi:hypothetical protein